MKHIPWKTALGTALSVGLIAAPLAAVPAFAVEASPAAGTSPVIINEAYLSGGSAGAAYKNKFVELYNTSDAAVSLDGWSLQYRSATGTGVPSTVVPLTGTIAAKGLYLLKGGSNGTVGQDLPAADATGTGFNPAIGGGTIVLAKQATAVSGLATGSVIEPANVADLLGYGSSLTFETQAATAPSGTGDVKSLNRSNGIDSNNNAADLTLNAAITPKAANGPAAPVDPPVDPGPVTPPAVKTIAEIQGSGTASPLVGSAVTTRGKVTAAFPTGGFAGYYIQTPGTGGDLTAANHSASDAIFVFSSATAGSVQIGDYVEVTGAVSEYFGMTQVTVAAAADLKKLTEAAPEVKATGFALPAEETFRESLEGMLLAPQGPVTVSDNYSLNQYGEIGLAGGTTPLEQPTAVAEYGSAAYTATVAANAARGIKLDDGATTNFLKDATTKALELPYLTTADPVRVGAPVSFKTNVVLSYTNNSWKFQPLTHLTPANADTVQPAGFGATRAEAPAAVGGNLKIASFNVLNYFPTTGDTISGCKFYTDRAGNPITVSGGCNVRGAANAENLKRQQDKIVAAISKSGADVVTLMEVENSAQFGKNRDDALSKLVDALNIATPGIWDYVRTPANAPPLTDEDMIRTAFIFKKAAAEPVGESVILNDTVAFASARKPMAQVFKPVGAADDKKFIAIANHFKSKGSAATPDDTDKGQGASNLARTAQAKSLLAFSNDLQASKGTDKVFLIGDFNSYAKEDPINVLTAAGYMNQDEKAKNADGSAKHSYLFGGMVGSLDHILASPGANAVVTGADIWNINSVESVALEYSRYNNNVTDYYAADQFRASDHDPVVVGLNLPVTPASVDLNFLGINDFHGRIDSNTVFFAGTIEKLRAQAAPGATAFLSAGDNIGASLFASAVAKDQPTIDVLNALELRTSAVGNHEFDGGWADLRDRVVAGGSNAKFPYLGANVYKKGTTEPVLPEYTVLDMNGVKVAVIGTVTQEVPSLVTPAGIADLEFGDAVDAINRVAAKIKAGKLADVIIVENHDGAGSGVPEGSTLAQEVAAGGPFARMVTEVTPDVAAIFNGHTHKQYSWDAPVPGVEGKTRPIVQTGNYGEYIGQIQLTIDTKTMSVTGYKAGNVKRTTTADQPADVLVRDYPRVAAVKTIVDKALADAAVVGNQPVGKVTADITTAFTAATATTPAGRDDRGSESTLGNLVADSLVDSLKAPELGGAEIGVVNPGGLRNELYFAPDGTITYAEANAVLPFVNNLWTTSLTGAQFKTLLEQQWQTNPDGTVPSRAYQQLGLSKNVNYTYDAARAAGDRITSIRINGAVIDPAKSYRIGTFNFLATGGDNFRIFKSGTDTKDSGLVDRDAWIKYLQAHNPVAPDFARRSVAVVNTTAAEVKGGEAVTLAVSKLDLTSLGSPANTSLRAEFTDAKGTVTDLGSVPVSAGAASVDVKVPAGAAAGTGTLVLTAVESGTVVKTSVLVAASTPVPPKCTAPVKPQRPADLVGQANYGQAMAAYRHCLKG
ncbi:multifunctional nuclease/2',3'-cyclic-nucleotide 2'-phosphodiesterase/5'-nucleotidase/3'-nucleotidase [Arthrobacter sp. NicSoilB4]|uniref:ExeM/NucH family extracellular endonuclease n=1 Tax=Arthrobacter sp. NicSoilB4 TaxID=2830997 RepID=UPI001CC416EA|nr:ExeM/NucH family extracellular endonuclease [Arthrobacter sp. NicSoilB4]BCW65764.1 multifunctional nuclease/2',3'-cyclic-nucleotide 2'-phosphodiesterase/5'-nucleotidase/3'-nucleotidase [Arthrobacter sp. NicSoilB4]